MGPHDSNTVTGRMLARRTSQTCRQKSQRQLLPSVRFPRRTPQGSVLRTTQHPASMPMSNGEPDPELGTLSILPTELRFQIYSYLMPSDFSQVYNVDLYTGGLCLRADSSPPPAFLLVSKTLHDEAVQSAMSERKAEIIVSADLITSNFLLYDRSELGRFMQPNEYLFDEKFYIPVCKELFIGLKTPSPRNFVETATLRHNVTTVINLLNGVQRLLPRLRFSFEVDEQYSDMMYYFNDFVMVMGPLCRLHGATRDTVIDRSSRWIQPNDGRMPFCQALEHAMRLPLNTASEAATRLKYEQALIDVKMDIALDTHAHDLDNIIAARRSRPFAYKTYTASILFELLNAGHRLGKARPEWWDDLFKAVLGTNGRFQGPRIGRPNRVMRERVFCAPDATAYEISLWAPGQSLRNPFY